MKKIYLLLIFLAIFLYAKPQATLEHIFVNKTAYYPCELTYYGWVYPGDSSDSNNNEFVKVYSIDYILLKTIPLPKPAGNYSSSTLYGISDDLFNSDNKIEVLFSYYDYGMDDLHLIVSNEDGQIIQDFPGHSYYGIYNVNGKFKMETSTLDSFFIWSLPGTMLNIPKQEKPFEHYTIFPNPCRDLLNVATVQPISSITISTMDGDKVEAPYYPGEKETKINTQKLAVGVYIYRIVLRDGYIITGKFLKN